MHEEKCALFYAREAVSATIMRNGDGMSPQERKIRVAHTAPLGAYDTEEQTQGCRATSPANCKNFGLAICAFINHEHICHRPPRGWAKHYHELKGL